MGRQLHMITRINFEISYFFAFLIERWIFLQRSIVGDGGYGRWNGCEILVRMAGLTTTYAECAVWSPFLAANNHVRRYERRETGMLDLSETRG